MDQELRDALDDLEEIAGLLKSAFVGKDDLVEMLVVCAIAKEHLLIVGPPGTAKSELVGRFAAWCVPDAGSGGNGRREYFEYLFTRFTEPNEIFGPVDIGDFREGKGYHRVTGGMLPRADIVFLDEVFKANSAILNALLTILNERKFYNGGVAENTPLMFAVGAANEVPEDPGLGALFDRFLVRIWTDNVEESQFPDLMHLGWRLEQDRIRAGAARPQALSSPEDLRQIHRALDRVFLDDVLGHYRELVRRIRAEGIALSDRRVVKLLKLIAASALRSRRERAGTGDFWVLRHVWNRPEQIPHLQTIVEPYLEGADAPGAAAERSVDALAGDLETLGAQADSLKREADYADFLRRAEQLRRALLGHSDREASEPLLERLDARITETLSRLEDDHV